MNINDEILEIKQIILDTVPVSQIYIFGSYAKKTQHAESDYDFYVVIPDETVHPLDATRKISSALRLVRKKPIDMLVGYESKFEKNKNIYSIEKEVVKTGLKLYG